MSISIRRFAVSRDVTWTLAPEGGSANATVQRVYCRCRPSSVPYLVRRQAHTSPEGNPRFIYAFACSPQSVSSFPSCSLFHIPYSNVAFEDSSRSSKVAEIRKNVLFQRLRCQHKEPCRLFTVRKRRRSQLEEVNASPLCQCPKGHRCPRRHTDPGSLPARSYSGILEIKTYSGYCVPSQSHRSEATYTV